MWLGTMAKPSQLRDNPAAAMIEKEMLEDALDSAGASTENNVNAVMARIKKKSLNNFWPIINDIKNAADELRTQAGSGPKLGDGNRAALSRDDLFTLETKVIPNAREMLRNPALKQHGEATLRHWGEPL